MDTFVKNDNIKNDTAVQPVLYEVASVNLASDFERDAAWNEMLCNQYNLLTDYKDWAKEAVSYRNLDDGRSSRQLNRCNDAYTISMWMNCLTPLQRGISIRSVLSTWLSFKAMDAVDPDFKMSSARMMSNLRAQLSPQMSEFCKSHPCYRKSIEAFDRTMSDMSSRSLSAEIKQRMDTNSLDSMIMTPRQIAALKVNFMEQYYVDTRMYNPNDADDIVQLEILQSNYDKAMRHLEIIANNGGFDMSVVAAEERYIVGMKIQDNPRYANIFVETSDIYGARPCNRGSVNNPSWSGDFYTADGHIYTTGGNRFGAFTVRLATKDVNDKGDELSQRAEQYAAMMSYLDSKECIFDKDKCDAVKKSIEASIQSYKESAFVTLRDDGFKQSVIECAWDKCFNETYEAALDGKLTEQDDINKAFATEICYIMDRHCVQSLDITFVPETNSEDQLPEMMAMYDELERKVKQNQSAHAVDGRDGISILRDARRNLADAMSVEDISDLMLHTATNMLQGKQRRNTYGRSHEATGSGKENVPQQNRANTARTNTRQVPYQGESEIDYVDEDEPTR